MSESGKVWLDGAKGLLPETVTLRRKIHEHPELGLHLPKTVAAVREALDGLDVKIETGPSTSGLIVTLQGPPKGGPCCCAAIWMRCRCPRTPTCPSSRRSRGGCTRVGMNSHTAMLAGAVKLLHKNRAKLAGTVKFMFQPGEEGHFGALRMIEDGLIDRHPKPDGAFAMHITPNVPTGIFTAKAGAFMASTDTIHIRVVGKGGHASTPHFCVDPMPVACEIVLALQSFVTRRISAFDPVVLTIAQINGGTTNNVIPEAVTLVGTLRSVSESSRKRAKEGLKKVAEKVAEAHDARAEVTLTAGYDVTVNDARMVALAAETARGLFGEHGFAPMPSPVMGAEDWSYVLQRIPGCMVFLGVAPEGCDHHHAAPCHSNRMMLDENAMANGIALYAAVAERFLDSGLPAQT